MVARVNAGALGLSRIALADGQSERFPSQFGLRTPGCVAIATLRAGRYEALPAALLPVSLQHVRVGPLSRPRGTGKGAAKAHVVPVTVKALF